MHINLHNCTPFMAETQQIRMHARPVILAFHLIAGITVTTMVTLYIIGAAEMALGTCMANTVHHLRFFPEPRWK